ncbi:uncharacterized protein CIMG_05667 [Coccidioides immitis RS]|uniref:Uncharacterized protein n=3 Tax=Coccidioides immitis TaxID=5501 RepID=A0A0E1RZK4_COCIM|nr:uncharacterized protein CIMG_05667 [Coccidioides immitis RS]EAS34643.1 hypothetical protein CIMG_05667 [Coccidioides immitis RS]KMP05816.1 hypothetical protein CIRG_05497 [Coccidioides immitis RMSCC 2394]KMU92510.1 hypothetical protein CIHG_10244 [Coccidioides immitis H538.4]
MSASCECASVLVLASFICPTGLIFLEELQNMNFIDLNPLTPPLQRICLDKEGQLIDKGTSREMGGREWKEPMRLAAGYFWRGMRIEGRIMGFFWCGHGVKAALPNKKGHASTWPFKGRPPLTPYQCSKFGYSC